MIHVCVHTGKDNSERRMGFPLGWTDLEDSETPSFQPSQSTSDAA